MAVKAGAEAGAFAAEKLRLSEACDRVGSPTVILRVRAHRFAFRPIVRPVPPIISVAAA